MESESKAPKIRSLPFPKRAQEMVNALRSNIELFQSSPAPLATVWAWALALGYLENKQETENLGQSSPSPLVNRDAFEKYYGDLAFFIAAAHKKELEYLTKEREKEAYEIAQEFVNAGIFYLDKLMLSDDRTELREDILIKIIYSLKEVKKDQVV